MDNWTVQSVLDWTTDYFNRSDIESARLEAELLLASVLNCRRLDLALKKDSAIPQKQLEVYKNFIKTRRSRKPLSYILGEHEFMGIKFKVNENTLIPRPETEVLVEEAVNEIRNIQGPVLLDLCTGSGCIAVSIATMADVNMVYATDISAEALSICWQNVSENRLAGKIFIKQGDMFEAIEDKGVTGKIDLITCNPPYIAHDEFSGLMPELGFEPRLALDGGKDGLDFYRRLVKEGKIYLKPTGCIIVELNTNKTKDIMELFKQEGFKIDKIRKDFAGLDRVLIAHLT